jgi:hypothetical protein
MSGSKFMPAVTAAVLLQVSWDFYNAAKHGFLQLQEQFEQLQITPQSMHCWDLEAGLKGLPAANGWTWQQWSTFLSGPLPYKLPELKAAAEQLRAAKSGTKAELVVRLLGGFGLKAPSKAPPKLLRVIALERITLVPWSSCEELTATRRALLRLFRTDDDLKEWGPGWHHAATADRN